MTEEQNDYLNVVFDEETGAHVDTNLPAMELVHVLGGLIQHIIVDFAQGAYDEMEDSETEYEGPALVEEPEEE